MIVVKLELWPFGDESHRREIGRMYIANDGAGTTKRGSYNVAVCRKGSVAIPRGPISPDRGPAPVRIGQVHNYPRQSYSVWRLIARAVLACFPDEARGGTQSALPLVRVTEGDPVALGDTVEVLGAEDVVLYTGEVVGFIGTLANVRTADGKLFPAPLEHLRRVAAAPAEVSRG